MFLLRYTVVERKGARMAAEKEGKKEKEEGRLGEQPQHAGDGRKARKMVEKHGMESQWCPRQARPSRKQSWYANGIICALGETSGETFCMQPRRAARRKREHEARR